MASVLLLCLWGGTIAASLDSGILCGQGLVDFVVGFLAAGTVFGL